MNIKISVIVPVYKVEQYIEKCIQSLLDQTYTNFEALIVDDGSPDQSIAIVKKIAGDDSRFVFLEKENGGLSSARNYGLDRATGDLVYFLDSDDYIAKETLEKCLIPFQKDPSVDIVIFGTNWITTSGEIIKQTISDVDKYYNEDDILLINDSIDHMACNKIYKKNIFDNVRFFEGIIYEDTELIYKLIFQKKIYLLKEYLYFYVQREGSIMSTFDINSIKSRLHIYEGYQFFLRKNNMLTPSMIETLNKYYYSSLLFNTLTDIIQRSDDYLTDSKKLMNYLDPAKVNIKAIVKYYPIYSKQFLGFILFKGFPGLFKVLYLTLYGNRERI